MGLARTARPEPHRGGPKEWPEVEVHQQQEGGAQATEACAVGRGPPHGELGPLPPPHVKL